MNYVMKKIFDKVEEVKTKSSFVDIFFGDYKDLLPKSKLIIFGAGSFSKELYLTLKEHNINVDLICDSNNNKIGTYIFDKKVVPVNEALKYKNAVFIVGSVKYADQILQFLQENNIKNIVQFDSPKRLILAMYVMIGTYVVAKETKIFNVKEEFLKKENDILKAYEILEDNDSKELFIDKMALLLSNINFHLFENFIQKHSLPYKEFGAFGLEGTTEDYYYFNNDIIKLGNDEIYVDIGAYDGDTVLEFVKSTNNLYNKIFAFEPDKLCYERLIKNTKNIKNLYCYNMGVWDKTTTLSFQPSNEGIHDQAAIIQENGTVTIDVVSIDEFLKEKTTFLKMDPGGNVIPKILIGAKNHIKKYNPKISAGVYHSIYSLFEIPLILKSIEPKYKIYLRHFTYHLCDTNMVAYV